MLQQSVTLPSSGWRSTLRPHSTACSRRPTPFYRPAHESTNSLVQRSAVSRTSTNAGSSNTNDDGSIIAGLTRRRRRQLQPALSRNLTSQEASAPAASAPAASAPAASAPAASAPAASTLVASTPAASAPAAPPPELGQPPHALLVVEVFAGSYSAGRLVHLVNSYSKHTQVCVGAYTALELENEFHMSAPSASLLRLQDQCYLPIHGSITQRKHQKQLLDFVDNTLRRSAANTGEVPRIDGVLVVGGPPCTTYSQANVGNMPVISTDEGLKVFLERQVASDKIVEAFFSVYSRIKARCALHPHPITQRPVLSCLVMENPWSIEDLVVRYSDEEAAALNGQVAPGEDKHRIPMGLRCRPIMQRNRVARTLWYTQQHYCSYGHLQHPMKPTAIFSDLIVVPETKCICHKCNGRVKRPHKVQVDQQANGDAERAVWPDVLVLRIFRLFHSHVQQELGLMSTVVS